MPFRLTFSRCCAPLNVIFPQPVSRWDTTFSADHGNVPAADARPIKGTFSFCGSMAAMARDAAGCVDLHVAILNEWALQFLSCLCLCISSLCACPATSASLLTALSLSPAQPSRALLQQALERQACRIPLRQDSRRLSRLHRHRIDPPWPVVCQHSLGRGPTTQALRREPLTLKRAAGLALSIWYSILSSEV